MQKQNSNNNKNSPKKRKSETLRESQRIPKKNAIKQRVYEKNETELFVKKHFFFFLLCLIFFSFMSDLFNSPC
jgi:hypothetical protein